ncbi:hypothetical protein PDE_01151 [Penicillium oxalicum 114-2]|uniref:Uncharacterized protein n=1 Tax=Penicillium oxalicum (strain 114-2 / CGMCC 5302) TaxID=933388 RepID=S7Z6M6_PENO1|nr:hypothetical protein PDE_01151 [Penicillium oxalicum 114-2]
MPYSLVLSSLPPSLPLSLFVRSLTQLSPPSSPPPSPSPSWAQTIFLCLPFSRSLFLFSFASLFIYPLARLPDLCHSLPAANLPPPRASLLRGPFRSLIALDFL